jgi:DNA gyrase subunit A
LKQALRVYLEHRLEIVRRRSEFELARASERAHILEGLLMALDNLDETIKIIRKSQTVESARDNLKKSLKVSEEQAQAILDMQLRRLASLERKKIQDEHKEKVQLIKYLEGLLKSPKKMREVITEELTLIKSAYGDIRRTVIVEGAASSATAEDLMMPEEVTWVTCTVDGNLSRSFSDSPPKVTTNTKEPPRFIAHSTTGQTLYLFASNGECATVPVQQLPQGEDGAGGMPFSALCPFPANAEIVSMVSLPNTLAGGYLFLTSETGQVKRIRMEDLPGMTSKTFTVMNVGSDDRLGWAFPTDGQQEILLTTSEAQAIRFKELEVRSTGLPAGGMRGIKLIGQRSKVVGANIVVNGQYVWAITDDGVAKISPIDDYPTQGRAGGGVIAMRLPKSSRGIAAATIGRQDDNIIVLTNKSKPKYMRIGLAELIKRGRAGGEYVISMTRQNEAVSAVVDYQSMYVPVEFEPELVE